ncbi:DUF502 domain-containing protein [Haloarcula nitratireducens]|uniref:DUF502 domain-containing protein n=1 Tax=Haloarcula nitratireducens TaxID=2487749 RepID=A0AAW4P8Z4_9EURY|nr:DUF502 domain-containing protein [Halomicroarcula nitratireducens]MBX0294407.1 DUF502 domain-containing protein [Halomicroarcula nitratireducens]
MTDRRVPEQVAPTTVKKSVRQAFITGFAMMIPLIVTLLIIGFVVNSLSNVLDPVVAFTFRISGSEINPAETPAYLVKVLALVVFVAAMFGIGFIAERQPGGGRIEDVFDTMMKRIPAIGSLYRSFDEMSEMLLDNDTQSFKDVVLVEYPTRGSYTVAFVTASTPRSIEDATGNEEMVTLFMPMAPNPVMGGYVIHVDIDRVYDADMTVEEGVRSIVTSGVAIGEGNISRPIGESSSVPGVGHPAEAQYRPSDATREPTPRTGISKREDAYSDDVSPEHADTPEGVARQHTEDTATTRDAEYPTDLERGEGTIGNDTERLEDIGRGDTNVGRDASRPEDIERGEGTIGDDADRPADVERGEGTLGDDADHPEDIEPDEGSGEEQG